MFQNEVRNMCQSMMATGIFHDKGDAEAILRASLLALRDRLPKLEAYRLGTHLPLELKDWYFENWRNDMRQSESVNKSEFLAEVNYHLQGIEDYSLAELVPVAMKRILSVLSPEEASHIKQLIPVSMRDIFDDRIEM